MKDFTHLDDQGHVQMVDVTEKPETFRKAEAQAIVRMRHETLERILSNQIKKGNVFETARIAGIMAAKKTSGLIPLCHPLSITHVHIDILTDTEQSTVSIISEVKTKGQTGVEMEALTAASISALTIYDMCKSYDKEMSISEIYLLKKTGGKSGEFIRPTT
ncbi:MAG: cyclic pyranopterin monophosphate synthase MoaC [Desulfobacterales bacterium]|nr:cyclic pyranopterin monophosphate synthase MoaC [Desulfobacterales bacterium]